MLLATFLTAKGVAQVGKTINLHKVPPQWVWKKNSFSNQWAVSLPIQNELKRIFQPLPDGIHATYGIAWGDGTVMGLGTPRNYSNYLMLKKYEYDPFKKQIIPEGETGCWIYFQPNTLTASHWQLPGYVDKIRLNGGDGSMYLCNIRIETDANGNRILYTDAYGEENKMQGYCFAAGNRLPVRRLSRRELFSIYKLHMDRVWDELIAKYEKSITKDESFYKGLTAEQKKQESYWPDLLLRNKKDLSEFKQNKEQLALWFSAQMQRKDLDAPAVAENLFENIDVKKLDVKNGFNIWVDDPSIFDKTKSPDLPQFLFVKIRRQDGDLPKKLFIDRFCEAFNLDILYKMIGEAPKKPGGINTIATSLGTSKTETKSAQENESTLTINFQQDAAGSFPSGWQGMKNITVQNYTGGNRLALSKAGYWYPRQFNKPIESGFTLSFDLEWNKDISYYSGHFALTLAEMQYDNATQGFKTAGNERDYYSFYDSYSAEFHRIVLRFDPHFNDGGQLQVTAFDKRGIAVADKKVLLPLFYKEKNRHQLQISRSSNTLIVHDNGKIVAEVENVFTTGTLFNAYVFSRYKSNNEAPTDVYYLNNIQVTY